MRIIAFGDSFTMGLITEPERYSIQQSHENSFINRLKHLLPVDKCINLADPGASNLQILFNLRKWLLNNSYEDTFVFIGWTTFTRESVWDEEQARYITNTKNRTTDIRQTTHDTECAILSACSMLERLNIKYCMIQAFEDHTRLEKDFLINKNIEIPGWINWKNNNNTLWDICLERYLEPKKYSDALEYFKRRKVKNTKYLADCLHPSPEGHQLIANTLAPYIKEIL